MRRWDIRKELTNLRDRANRILEQGFASVSGNPSIAVDMYETEDAVIVRTSPVMGVRIEDIDVSFTGDTLTIRGKTQTDVEVDESSFLRRERRFGDFHRTLTIPRPIKAEEASANYENGVLTITIPKEEEARPKVIEVKASDS